MPLLPLEPDERWKAVFADANLPAAVVELEAVRHNRQQVIEQLGEGTTTIRVATRGLRSTSLLRHLLIDPELVRSGTSGKMQGLACDTVLEACALLELGFDDVLIHTPVCTMGGALRVAEAVSEGRHLVPTVDCREHVELLGAAARQVGTEVGVCIDVDVSWQPAAEVRVGRFRSSLGDVAAARDLGTLIGETDGLTVVGVSAWASQVADAARPEARRWWTGPFHGWMNARSLALAADRRVAVVESLKADGHPIRLVNGGSTATLAATASDNSVTEITVGGAFLCPTRCDHIGLDLQPAVFFAGRICRIPNAEHVVVQGIGDAGIDARPVYPEGLNLLPNEGLRSTQTPLSLSGTPPAIGSPVVFRPASVAPLFDRVEEVWLLDGQNLVERATTFRGIGIGHQ